MAFHTRSGFAKLCGITKNPAQYISSNLNRKKIILSGDLFDDTIPQNADFIAKEQEKNGVNKIEAPEEKPVKHLRLEKPAYPEPKIPNIEDPDEDGDDLDDGDNSSYHNLDKTYKISLIKKIKVETRLKEIQEQKVRGEVIPTEFVKTMFTQHSQSIITEFKNGVEDIITIFGKKAGMNTNDIAEMRGVLTDIINTSVDKSVDLSKRNLNNLIKDFAAKRGPGERD